MGEKTKRIEEHLLEHPADYQAVIALYKSRSADIEHELERRRIGKRKMIAMCKRRVENGEHSR